MMSPVQVGVQLRPNHATMAEFRGTWERADELGVDAMYTFDHFFPIDADRPEGGSFECWTSLAAIAVTTSVARMGPLVTCYGYRNPDLLADMARTVDHLCEGRLVLGIGAGWHEPDYRAYGFPMLSLRDRVEELETAIGRIRRRLDVLDPAPLGPVPILIGGVGERRTLPLVARVADEWNAWGSVADIERLGSRLDDCCDAIGRDPASIRRSVAVFEPPSDAQADDYVAAGAHELILVRNGPDYRIDDVVPLLDWRDRRTRSHTIAEVSP